MPERFRNELYSNFGRLGAVTKMSAPSLASREEVSVTDSLEGGLALMSLLNYHCTLSWEMVGRGWNRGVREGHWGQRPGEFWRGVICLSHPQASAKGGRQASPLPLLPHRTCSVHRVCSLGRESSLQNGENFSGGLVGQEPPNIKAGL